MTTSPTNPAIRVNQSAKSDAAFDQQQRLTSPTGANLNLYRAHAQKPRAIVQINHGLSEHAGRYARFAAYLAERGFEVFAHDHRGHGQTRAPGAVRGHFGHGAGIAALRADVLAVHEQIGREYPGLPVIIFGHSMGGMIALDFALSHSDRIAGAAIWNAPFATRLEALAGKAVLRWERFRLGSDVPSRILPSITFRTWARAFPDRRTDFDWLSRDAKEVDKYVADPLCGFEASVGVWKTLFDLSLGAADAARYRRARKDLALHMAGGEDDPSTRGGKTVLALEKRLRAQGFSNLKTVIYEKMRHETLNEMDRDQAMQVFTAWVEKIID